ncbi:NUDIX hydrolase [Spirosoma luteum]|uniref:NUDIX hydrolase n=1 Tax=Spirosoma luteum TaxID=431553 RepID=UPI000374D03E|nr:NUDIX hydrolase [Spirosoma luteum]
MNESKPLNQTAKYQKWHRHLEENQVSINGIDPVYVHRAEKDGSILYALLKVDAQSPEGTKLNPICFLKGDAVSILVVLIDQQTEEKYVVLIRQRRIGDGSITYEHPAGMIDEKDASPQAVAMRELGEETGLRVEPTDVKSLFSRPLFSATATSDETLYFFYLERRMPLAEIKAMHEKSTGKEGENEHTQLHIATFPEAQQKVANLHGVLAHLLYLKQVGDYELMGLL